MDFISKCEICGKEYDSYHTTFYIQYSRNDDDRKCACPDCIGKEKNCKPYRFANHLPMYCDGFDTIVNMFDTKEEAVEWILNKYQDSPNRIVCMDKAGVILTVSKDEKFWWVVGGSNLETGTFPNWKEKVIELHGSL